MEGHVVSKDLAERLKAAGFSQSTEHNWCRSSFSDDEFKLHRKGQIETREVKERFAAPLSDELLESLPKSIELDGHIYWLVLRPNRAHYWSETARKRLLSTNYEHGALGADDSSMANSLAILWLYLHDHNLLPKTEE